MRVAIATVFDEYPNYGSFLQAYALQIYLRELGVTAEFIDTFSINRIARKIRESFTRDVRQLRFNVARTLVYAAIRRRLNRTRRFKAKEYDAIIAGSDEIWNLKNTTFAHQPLLFCEGIKAKRRIAYAPSANGMTAGDFSHRAAEISWMRAIDYLSARDPCTVDLLREHTARNVTPVVDPTFLIDWSLLEQPVHQSDYILVYCYGLGGGRLELVEQLAERTGKELVIVGHYAKARHALRMVNPLAFLGYLRNASFVVSDSFHGTILSIRYEKQFCSFVGNKYKVRSALATYGLSSRDATRANDLWSLYRSSIDYGPIRPLIAQQVSISKQFLRTALGLGDAQSACIPGG